MTSGTTTPRATLFILSMLALHSACAVPSRPAAAPPNIVFVLFDDLGYGQPRPYAADSEFAMPHLEHLATEGMTFTDAHSASAVCTPTRYGLLTGRHPSRIGQFGVLTTWSPPLIPAQRMTVASLLRGAGYHTACIGKWHLGLHWVAGKPGRQELVPIGERFTGGPTAIGFDYFFGFTHARNITTILEQDRVVAHAAPVDNQPRMIEQAVSYIEQRAADKQPFFLYFAMCPPHTPIAPAAQYVGKSGAADLVGKDPAYGDWILQGDAMLGQLRTALARAGLADNTLLIAASDNGAEQRAYAPLRASKRSIYEGGHRVPLIAHWPGHIAAGSRSDATVCLTDLLATAAELLGAALPADAGEDSVSMLPVLLGTAEKARREESLHQSLAGDLALRRDRWKLIIHRDGRRELFDLQADLGETQDLSKTQPGVVAQLTQRLQEMIDRGRSTPGPSQANDFALVLAAPK